MVSLFNRNDDLIVEVNSKELYIIKTKKIISPITRPLANTIIYDDTSGVIIVERVIKLVEVYNNGSESIKYIFEGRFVNVDWKEQISAARCKRIAVQLLNNGDLFDCKSGSKIYDLDHIPLIRKISLIDPLDVGGVYG